MKVFDLLKRRQVFLDVVVAHAARANKPVVLSDADKNMYGVPSVSSDGVQLNSGDFFVVRTAGNSLVKHRINDGDHLIARRVTTENRTNIASGAIVVVSAEARSSNVKERLRVVSKLNAGKFEFLPDAEEKHHTPRAPEQVIGVVTHHVGK